MCSKSKDDVQIFILFSTKNLCGDKASPHISFYQNLTCNGGHAIGVAIGIGGGAGP